MRVLKCFPSNRLHVVGDTLKVEFVLLIFGENQRGICPSKSKTVGDGDIDLFLLCGVRYIIAIEALCYLVQVKRGWKDVLQVLARSPQELNISYLMDSENRKNGLHSTRSTKEMPNGSLCAAYCHTT